MLQQQLVLVPVYIYDVRTLVCTGTGKQGVRVPRTYTRTYMYGYLYLYRCTYWSVCTNRQLFRLAARRLLLRSGCGYVIWSAQRGVLGSRPVMGQACVSCDRVSQRPPLVRFEVWESSGLPDPQHHQAFCTSRRVTSGSYWFERVHCRARVFQSGGDVSILL